MLQVEDVQPGGHLWPAIAFGPGSSTHILPLPTLLCNNYLNALFPSCLEHDYVEDSNEEPNHLFMLRTEMVKCTLEAFRLGMLTRSVMCLQMMPPSIGAGACSLQ